MESLRKLTDNSIRSVVTDAPYGLGSPPYPLEMVRAWMDTGHLAAGRSNSLTE